MGSFKDKERFAESGAVNGDSLTRGGFGTGPGSEDLFLRSVAGGAISLSSCELGETEEELSRGRRRAKVAKRDTCS